MIKILLKCIACVLVMLLVIITVSFISISEKPTHSNIRSSTQITPKYTLTDYKGKVALFKVGFAMPVEIYDVYISSLPIEEQERVKKGITAQSDEEVIKLIEAYTS